MTHRARDAFTGGNRLPGTLLGEVCVDAPVLQDFLTDVTSLARGTRAKCHVRRRRGGAVVRASVRRRVARRAPLLDKWMVRARVAFGTAVRDAGAGVGMYRGQHLASRGRGHMLETRPVTALALHVVISRIRHAGVADGGGGHCIPLVADRMAPLTRRLLPAARLERGPRVGMARLLPLCLLGAVTIAARCPAGRLVVVAEAVGGGGRQIGSA